MLRGWESLWKLFTILRVYISRQVLWGWRGGNTCILLHLPLEVLHNPQRKKRISPKLRRPWEGPYVAVEQLNDAVYRIQWGPWKKPEVVHRDRFWKYSGIEHADWFQGPVQDKSEDVSSCTTTQQENQEVNTKGRASVRRPRKRQKLPPRLRENSQDKEACDRASRQQHNQEGLRWSSREAEKSP